MVFAENVKVDKNLDVSRVQSRKFEVSALAGLYLRS